MHACLTAAVINHCLEDYWRNVLVWAHSLVYLTGCSELQCKMNRHRCASSTASQHRAVLYQESIFWLLTVLLCVLGYLLSRVCSSDLHRMWGPLEFESAVNSHNEKLFKLAQHIILAGHSQAGPTCFCRYRHRPLGALRTTNGACGAAGTPAGGIDIRPQQFLIATFFLPPFPRPCVNTDLKLLR